MEIALEARNHGLVLLLLCNGYDPNLERHCALDLTLRARRWDLLDLLLEAGADPLRISVGDLLDTYNSKLIERFCDLGVDLTASHELAAALGYHTSNKPLFGFAKRHRGDLKIQKELDMALAHHAAEGNEKGVLLCLWAGADPHAPVPSLRHPDLVDSDDDDQVESNDRFLGWTAIEEASSAGHVEILERLGPDPSRDNFDDLYSWADSSAVIELLARSALPKNVGEVVHRYISRFGMYRSDWTARERLRSLFQAGARWDSSGSEQITGVRRSLCKLSDENFVEVLKLLATDAYCSETILHELVGTPTMRARMKKVGFIPAPSDESKGLYQPRPTRSREVLAKCGIVLPKPVPRLPYIVEIGKWKSNEREIRLTRAELFERVWSEPVEKLAKEWGLSDRGLGKACRRLQIPVPSRGFWAKLQHEKRMRRPRLPDVKPGEAEQVLIHVPTPRDSDGEAESG